MFPLYYPLSNIAVASTDGHRLGVLRVTTNYNPGNFSHLCSGVQNSGNLTLMLVRICSKEVVSLNCFDDNGVLVKLE